MSEKKTTVDIVCEAMEVGLLGTVSTKSLIVFTVVRLAGRATEKIGEFVTETGRAVKEVSGSLIEWQIARTQHERMAKPRAVPAGKTASA